MLEFFNAVFLLSIFAILESNPKPSRRVWEKSMKLGDAPAACYAERK